MASRRASPVPRRVVALKRADGEPLTRADIQYDVLDHIFSDNEEVFSDPYAESDNAFVCFRDLYIKAILHSPKATKALKDKIAESPTFAKDFAMLALLVNVGRVNTTMSFFPEMKTAIRTYHPVPSLQHTTGNMQDAPRIKQILKTSLLEDEAKNPPSTPNDILALLKSGQPPSTSVTNLIFVLAHHTGPVGQAHFQGGLDFLDLFLRTEISSESRGQTFLWLCYNYLEAQSADDDYDNLDPINPFSDPSKGNSPPKFTFLTDVELSNENQEKDEDVETCEKLLAQRQQIMQSHTVKDAGKASGKVTANGSFAGDEGHEDYPPNAADEPKIKGKRAIPSASVATSSKAKGKRPAVAYAKEKKPTITIKDKQKEREPTSLFPDLDEEDDLLDAFVKQRSLPRQKRVQEQYDHSMSLLSSIAAVPSKYEPTTSNGYDSAHRSRYAPYPTAAPSGKDGRRPRNRSHPRTMLQQAWQVVTSSDPLADSDDEMGGDEYARDDYIQRLSILNRVSQQRWPPFIPEVNMDAF